MRSAWTSALASLLLCGLATAQTVPGAPPELASVSPRLLTELTADSLSDAFPPVARAQGVSGSALLECTVALDGVATCSVREETPADMGFGEAALRLSSAWRFSPGLVNGEPIEGAHRRLRIPFENDLAEPVFLSDGLIVSGSSGDNPEVSVNWGEAGVVVTGRRVRVTMHTPRSSVFSDHPDLEETPPAEPVWHRPSPTPIDAGFYPSGALQEGLSGRAIVACVVRTDRQVNCALEREAPSGFGFGDAAIGVAARALEARLANAPNSALTIARLPVDFAPADAVTSASGAASPSAQLLPNHGPLHHMYPTRALELGIEGEALLGCEILPDLLVQCRVLDESSANRHFGDAALRAWQSMRVNEEEITSGRFRVGDRFSTRVRLQIQTW